MTISRARQILEITSASTREQVRSAYRRRVTQCHPDRLQGATEATRRHATQEMAAINEAYRLLCSAMLQTA
jgi:curved DNA-binding protein CbpA